MNPCTCRRGPGSCLMWDEEKGCTATEDIRADEPGHVIVTLGGTEYDLTPSRAREVAQRILEAVAEAEKKED